MFVFFILTFSLISFPLTISLIRNTDLLKPYRYVTLHINRDIARTMAG
jgi:hypothetical protein